MSQATKKLIAGIIAAVGLLLILIFQQGLGMNAPQKKDLNPQAVQTSDPQIISSKPQSGGVVAPTQAVEITFNIPIENPGEFKHKIDPEVEHTIKLSDDRKTVMIIPTNGFSLGQGYELTIQKDTKFDNKKSLSDPIIFGFKTIDYRGV